VRGIAQAFGHAQTWLRDAFDHLRLKSAGAQTGIVLWAHQFEYVRNFLRDF
jgi:hypothetical protein